MIKLIYILIVNVLGFAEEIFDSGEDFFQNIAKLSTTRNSVVNIYKCHQHRCCYEFALYWLQCFSNLEKVFAKYNKFAPPSRDVIIDLKIDLIWLNTVQPSTSYYDASFNWRVKWQDKRVSWSNTSSDISYIGKMISHRNLMVYIM